jgi:fermentation-respiration switch protein FrsA (DUF1100 family)
MARRRITFASEGIELVGDLRLPAAQPGIGAGVGGRPGWPGIVLTGPFTGVKEQVTGSYAEQLSAAGFITLAFDHRGFGESGGRRQHEDSQGKPDRDGRDLPRRRLRHPGGGAGSPG